MKDDSPGNSGPERDPANDADIISVQIQLAREAAGLSVSDVSRLTGISKTVLHGYERGRTKPGAREIRLLSGALKISPNLLILGSETFDSATPTFTSVYRKLKARPELSGLLFMMLGPVALPMLQEAELEGFLTILHALVKSRAPTAARAMVIGAEEVASFVDRITLPDGSLTLDPADLAAEIEAIQQRVAERVTAEPPTQGQETNQSV